MGRGRRTGGHGAILDQRFICFHRFLQAYARARATIVWPDVQFLDYLEAAIASTFGM